MNDTNDAAASQESSAAEPLPARTAPEGVLKGERGMGTALIAISAFLVVVAAFAAYANAFGVPFQGLDLDLIRNELATHRLVTTPQAFAMMEGAPLTLFSFALNWGLTPDRPAEFHFFNLLLHAINGVLIYLLGRRLVSPRLPEPVCMVAGILFVVHPLASESVYYLVGRSVLLGTAFGLLSLLVFLAAFDGKKTSIGLYSLSLLAYALSVASCFPMLLLPLVLPVLDACANGGGPAWRNRAWHGGFFALFAALAVAVWSAQGEASFPPAAEAGALAIFSNLGWRFLALLSTPLHLSPVWPAPESLSVNWLGAGLLLVMISGGVAAAIFRKPGGVALLLAAGSLAGMALLFPGESAYSERALYPALAGVALAVPWLLSLCGTVLVQRIMLGMAAVCIMAGFWLSFVRGLDWQDPVGLWNAAADEVPESALPSRNIARYLNTTIASTEDANQRNELLNLSVEHWQRVLDVDATDAEALAGLGTALAMQGKGAEAIPQLKKALRADPFNEQAAVYLALALDTPVPGADRFSQVREALQYYQRAAAEMPLPPELQSRYGAARLAVGDLGSALTLLEMPATANPESSAAATYQGLLQAVQRVQELEQQAQQLLAKDQRDVNAAAMRAEAMLMRGQWMTAFYLLDRALHRAPDHIAAWSLLGAVRARTGAEVAFIQEWGALHLDLPDAWRLLATRTCATGAWNAGMAYLKHFAATSPQAKPASITLAEIALELNQATLAQQYLQQEAEANPQDPNPWLALSDIAIQTKNLPEAQRLLGEAQRRGASEEELKKRSETAGVSPAAPSTPQRTVIR